MATVILSHRVKDYAKWRPVFDSDSERRTRVGLKNVQVFRAQDDPNNIYIQAEVDDPSAWGKMANDPELRQKMEEGGVISQPTALVLNRV
jgi:hypothetical protein